MVVSAISLDTRDDRLEIHRLLHALAPRRRVAFLKYACTQCPPTNMDKLPVPVVSGWVVTLEQAYRCDRADLILTNSIYTDLLQLFATWNLDVSATVLTLREWVRTAERS